MDSHCIVRADGLLVPDVLINLSNGEHPAQVLHQKQQDIILDGRHLHWLPVHCHLLRIVVEHQSAHLVDGLALRVQAPQGSVPAQIGLHPRHKLQRIEGLGDIIVRTDVQPENLVRVL